MRAIIEQYTDAAMQPNSADGAPAHFAYQKFMFLYF